MAAVKDTESVHYDSLSQEYERLVKVICEDHVTAATTHINDPAIRESLSADIRSECKEISDYRIAQERWHLEIDSRAKDRVVSFGEKLSCRFVTALLRDRVGLLSGIDHYSTNNLTGGRCRIRGSCRHCTF